MKVLFVGGTGIISTACTNLAAQRGIDLTLFRRNSDRPADIPSSIRTIRGDITNAGDRDVLRKSKFDVVVQWIAFTPADVKRDFETFRDSTTQYVFISSASAYEKPPSHPVITETTPLVNPYWAYSRDKIACEDFLMRMHRENNFPVTIVRPSHTYGDTQIPLAINSWSLPYTALDRMRKGMEVIVPGDGTSLWVLTHNSDFAKGLIGLLGNAQAVGEAFHITSDEVQSWDQIYLETAAAVGVEPRLVHISSDFLAACDPEFIGSLIGDKSRSVIFDNSKIKGLVPDYRATTKYSEGIRQTIAWFDADPKRQRIDEISSSTWDRLIETYKRGLDQAVREFR